MTADFGNFVTKTDKKQKTKDEMNPALKLLKHKKNWQSTDFACLSSEINYILTELTEFLQGHEEYQSGS